MAQPVPPWLSRRWALLLLALILACTAAARLMAIDLPLERDEGEYAYGGQLLLQGVPPYQAAYNMKFPGIYVAYAAILAVFGESTRGIHIGLLLVNAAAIVLVYLLGVWVAGRLAGVVAAASYAALSASPSVRVTRLTSSPSRRSRGSRSWCERESDPAGSRCSPPARCSAWRSR